MFILNSISINSQTDSIRINNLEKQIVNLNHSINNQKQDDNSLYHVKKDLIEVKSELENKHNDWLAYLANFWAIIGLAVGSITVFFSFKERIKREVDKQVTLEVAKEVKNNIGLLEEQLQEIKKHKAYKTDSKIIVINKLGTTFPTHFKKVLKLFNIDIDDPQNRVDIDNLAEFEDHLSKLRQADLILIENMVPDNVWDVKTHKEDYTNLANSICETTTMLYYGGVRLDTEDIEVDKQHFVSFVSASSQLYGNMLNLLKYKFELNK